MSEPSKKYQAGFQDGAEGLPPNRFMRTDPEYSAGYEAGSQSSRSQDDLTDPASPIYQILFP